MTARVSMAVWFAYQAVRDGRMTQSQAARHYGVAISSVYRAMQRAKKTPPPAAQPAEET